MPSHPADKSTGGDPGANETAGRFARAVPGRRGSKRQWWVADLINLLLIAALLTYVRVKMTPSRSEFIVFCLIGLACVGGLAAIRAGLRWEQRRWERRTKDE